MGFRGVSVLTHSWFLSLCRSSTLSVKSAVDWDLISERLSAWQTNTKSILGVVQSAGM